MNAERFWDGRADGFARAQDEENPELVGQVIEALDRVVGLAEKHVLDVGAGAGRYALPLAGKVASVTLADVSGNMLAEARQRAVARGIASFTYHKLDWGEVDVHAQGWDKAFDLVFASMVPPLREGRGLQEFTAASRGWCAINQFTSHRDSVREKLDGQLGAPAGRDPHNDPEFVDTLVTQLREAGQDPVVVPLAVGQSEEVTPAVLLERYSGRYGARAAEQGADLAEIIAGLADAKSGLVTVRRDTEAAVVLWQISA